MLRAERKPGKPESGAGRQHAFGWSLAPVAVLAGWSSEPTTPMAQRDRPHTEARTKATHPVNRSHRGLLQPAIAPTRQSRLSAGLHRPLPEPRTSNTSRLPTSRPDDRYAKVCLYPSGKYSRYTSTDNASEATYLCSAPGDMLAHGRCGNNAFRAMVVMVDRFLYLFAFVYGVHVSGRFARPLPDIRPQSPARHGRLGRA